MTRKRIRSNRRTFLRDSLSVLGSTALVQFVPGCGRTTSTTGRGKITFGSYADPAQNVLKEVFLPEFEKKTGIETEWVEADFSSWFQKAVNDGQTQAGAFDIYVLDDLWMPRFAGAGYLANLEELGFHPDTDFVESALDLGYWPPKTGPRQPGIDPKARPTLFGLPLIGDVQLLFYRNDVYASGPPATWDDVLRMARERSDPTKRQYGWVTRGVKGNPVVNSYFVLLHAFGGQMFEGDWKVAFNSPAAIEALEFYLRLLDYAPPGVAEFDSDQEGQTMLQGNAFAATMWTGWCGQVLGLFMTGIAASAPNKQGALEFFNWFHSSAVQTQFARAGGTPCKVSAFKDEDSCRKSRWLPETLKALSIGLASPRTADWYKIEDILGTALNQTLIEKGNAKRRLDAAASEATAFLKNAGYSAG